MQRLISLHCRRLTSRPVLNYRGLVAAELTANAIAQAVS